MAEEIPTFESMFRKSRGLDLAEGAPFEGGPTADKLRMKKSNAYSPDRDVLEKLASMSPEARAALLKQVDELAPGTPWDLAPKFSSGNKGEDGAWGSEEQVLMVPKVGHTPGPNGAVIGGYTPYTPKSEQTEPIQRSAGFREMVARECFEKTGRIPDVEFMDTYEVKKAADEADFNEMADAYADVMRGKEETAADRDAFNVVYKKKNADRRKKASDAAQPYGHRIGRTVDAASATSVPDEEKERYLGQQPEIMGQEFAKNPEMQTTPGFYNAIKGIVDTHLSNISDEKRKAIAEDLYKRYNERMWEGTWDEIYDRK